MYIASALVVLSTLTAPLAALPAAKPARADV